MRILIMLAMVATAGFSGCLGGTADAIPELTLRIRVAETDRLAYTFEATELTGADATQVTLEWNLGDGTDLVGSWSQVSKVDHAYAFTDATPMVSVLAQASDGRVGYALAPVVLGTGTALPPSIHVAPAPRWVAPGDEVTLDATLSNGPSVQAQYEWVLGPYEPTASERSMLGSQFDMSAMHDMSAMAPVPPAADMMAASPTSTGLLEPGESHVLDLPAEGVYYYVCHPHPWMQMKVVATDEAADETVDVALRNFAFSEPVVTVKPGGSVNFTNRDPTQHTASEQFNATGRVVSSTAVLRQPLAEGMYQARLVVTDPKGGLNQQAFGLRASADAPPRLHEEDHSQSGVNHVPPLQPQPPIAIEHRANWTQNLTIRATWASEPNQGTWRLTLQKDGASLASCAPANNECAFTLDVVPGRYTLVATVDGTAIQSAVDIRATAVQFTNPGFGDTMPAGGHHH